MISQRIHEKISHAVRYLQRFAGRSWYPPLVGILAALDNIVLVIPVDGILISSSMLTPRRWFMLALSTAFGSTVGAFVLAILVRDQGLPFILSIYPSLEETSSWLFTLQFFDEYGLFLVFLVALTPLAQQPAVILAALAAIPLHHLILVVLLGRAIKFLVMAYIGSHTPRLLKKLWGVKGELKDAGVKLES